MMMFFCSLTLSSRGRAHRGSHPRSGNYCVCDGWCTHTHQLHAHFSGVHTLWVHFAHSEACYTHAWLKGVCSAHVVISPSPFSCFTRPCSCGSLTVTSRLFTTSTTSLTFQFTRISELLRPKSAGQAHIARGRGVWLRG